MLDVPDVDAYLLLDVDAGPDTLNLPPQVSLPRIVAAGRTPLTVEEGIAVVAQRPEILSDENCFSFDGSPVVTSACRRCG